MRPRMRREQIPKESPLKKEAQENGKLEKGLPEGKGLEGGELAVLLESECPQLR